MAKASSFAEASCYAKATADKTAVKKDTADKTTDRFHGWTRIMKE